MNNGSSVPLEYLNDGQRHLMGTNQKEFLAKAVFLESKGELIFPGRVKGGADMSIDRPSESKNCQNKNQYHLQLSSNKGIYNLKLITIWTWWVSRFPFENDWKVLVTFQ